MKEIVLVITGLITLATMIVAFMTKILEYRNERAKSAKPPTNPIAITTDSTIIAAQRSRWVRGVRIFLSVWAVMLFILVSWLFLLAITDPTGGDTLTKRDFYYGLVLAILTVTTVIQSSTFGD